MYISGSFASCCMFADCSTVMCGQTPTRVGVQTDKSSGRCRFVSVRWYSAQFETAPLYAHTDSRNEAFFCKALNNAAIISPGTEATIGICRLATGFCSDFIVFLLEPCICCGFEEQIPFSASGFKPVIAFCVQWFYFNRSLRTFCLFHSSTLIQTFTFIMHSL